MIHNDAPPRHIKGCCLLSSFAYSINLAPKLAASLWMYPFPVQVGKGFLEKSGTEREASLIMSQKPIHEFV